MIRNLAAPGRRIGVLELPRTELNRLGRIGSIRIGTPAVAGPIVRMSRETPSNAAIWMGQVVQAQNNALVVTPGTLAFTPALPAPPSPTIGTWNSWAGPCFDPNDPAGDITPANPAMGPCGCVTSSNAASGVDRSTLLWLLGGAAVLLYAANGRSKN
jgi:hypothetical protein